MKKGSLFFVLLIVSIVSYCQEVNYKANGEYTHYISVGSLPKSSTAAYEKLKVEIFGGVYESNDMATTTYTIATRSGNVMMIERSGGGTSGYELLIFENADTNSYSCVLKNTNRWAVFNIKSTLLKSNTSNQVTEKVDVDIKVSDPIKYGLRDVTSEFKQIILTGSDRRGYIGVGTLFPQSELDVRGKIIANEVEIKVLPKGGADFVFKPEYNLRPLLEVEAFVKENQHLPDIPSEKEMIENGLNINDMQIKLLQKVEELTLYVIEQEKKYNALIEENKTIKEELRTLKQQ